MKRSYLPRSVPLQRSTPLAKKSARPFAKVRLYLDELARARCFIAAGAGFDYGTKRTWWGKCQRCNLYSASTVAALDWSHFISRSVLRTRWHPDNTHALCKGCHLHFHRYPGEFMLWMIQRLGTERFDKLGLIANARSAGKQDYKLLTLGLENELKAMGAGEHVEHIHAQVYGKGDA